MLRADAHEGALAAALMGGERTRTLAGTRASSRLFARGEILPRVQEGTGLLDRPREAMWTGPQGVALRTL